MPNSPLDQRQVDPELRAEIEAAYAAMEPQPTGGYVEAAPETKVQPFMKSLKTGAVVEQTEEARAQAELASGETSMEQMTSYLLHTGNLLRSYREAAANKPTDISYMAKPKTGILGKSLKMLTGSENVRMPRILQARPTHRELVQRESELGGHLFGQITDGEHWQFFNLDPYTWFWHKEWMDKDNKAHSNTTRYEVHENGIMKVQDGAPYYYIEGRELNNFMGATRLYYDRVSTAIYNRDPATGQPLAVS